jgi:glycosyltransferase involved in cell wall biosynthesis
MVSELDRAEALQVVGGDQGRIKVIPNGVDCDHNRPGWGQARDCRLVFNGSLTYSANYDAMRWFLGQIYPLVQEQMPQVSLTITGSLQGVDLSGLNLDSSVQFSGHVADVRPLVGGATACVVPMRQGSGTRIKILEAMALGTPVVATSKGAEGLQVSHGHDLLIADPPAEFATQVLRLLRDPDLRGRLAANAHHLVERHYDWRAIGQQFVNLLETL